MNLTAIQKYTINVDELDDFDLSLYYMGTWYEYSPSDNKWFYDIIIDAVETTIYVEDVDKCKTLTELLKKQLEEGVLSDIENGEVVCDWELHWDYPDVDELKKELLTLNQESNMSMATKIYKLSIGQGVGELEGWRLNLFMWLENKEDGHIKYMTV